MPRTVFISSFHPLISRNILATPLLRLLSEAGITPVVLAPEKKKDFFAAEFGREIKVESVALEVSRRDLLLRYLSLSALDTMTLRLKRKTEMAASGQWLVRAIGNRQWARKVLRFCSARFTPRGLFADLFGRYQPATVFVTDMQNEFDVRLMHEAQDRGIIVIGMVRSWDNLTSKGLLRVVPDILVVHSKIEKDEAITLHGIPEARIRVVGIPHYDRYVLELRTPYEEFCNRIGADPAKRLVLLAPTGDRYIKNNTVDAAILRLLDHLLPASHQILVRLPPTDRVAGLDGHTNEGRIIFDRPAKRFHTPKNAELSAADDRHLADSLYWSDLLVAGPSTIAVDAAFFDKPVVLIGFDGDEVRPYLDSIRRYYEYDHFQSVLRSGGVRLAKTKEDLATELNAYLTRPERDREGRRRMITEECFAADGKSTERLAEAIMEEMRHS